MNITKTEKMINSYGQSLARGTDEYGFRHIEWLEYEKKDIINAVKLQIAFFYQYNSLTEDNYNTLVAPLMYINSFIDEETRDKYREVARIIKLKQYDSQNLSSEIKDYLNFQTETMIDNSIVEDINSFIDMIRSIGVNDSIYFQKIYTLLGLEYYSDSEDYYNKTSLNKKSRKMRLKLLFNILEVILTITVLINKEIVFSILLGVNIIINIIFDLSADKEFGEVKLTLNGLTTYVILSVIGFFIFNPWVRGVVLLNGIADSISTVTSLPITLRNSKTIKKQV